MESILASLWSLRHLAVHSNQLEDLDNPLSAIVKDLCLNPNENRVWASAIGSATPSMAWMSNESSDVERGHVQLSEKE
jgi:hypothetical protein